MDGQSNGKPDSRRSLRVIRVDKAQLDALEADSTSNFKRYMTGECTVIVEGEELLVMTPEMEMLRAAGIPLTENVSPQLMQAASLLASVSRRRVGETLGELVALTRAACEGNEEAKELLADLLQLATDYSKRGKGEVKTDYSEPEKRRGVWNARTVEKALRVKKNRQARKQARKSKRVNRR